MEMFIILITNIPQRSMLRIQILDEWDLDTSNLSKDENSKHKNRKKHWNLHLNWIFCSTLS